MVTENETIEKTAKLEARVEAVKEDVADLKHDIKDLHSRISTGNREVVSKIEQGNAQLSKDAKEQHEAIGKAIGEVKTRVDVLERWRWMIVGAAIVCGYLIGHIDLISKLIK
jgi:hypothetical protein